MVKVQLSWVGEVEVRGLGLIPVVAVAVQEKWRGVITLSLLVTGLLAAYAMLVVMEYVPKRSALGCPYLLFIMTGYIVALIPPGAQVLTLRLCESSKKRRRVATKELPRVQQSLLLEEVSSSADPVPEAKLDANISRYPEKTEAEWWVQFIWVVYYAAGTLIFASIMAVTVIELFTWVVLACFTTAMSKMLAFRLCGHWKRECEYQFWKTFYSLNRCRYQISVKKRCISTRFACCRAIAKCKVQ